MAARKILDAPPPARVKRDVFCYFDNTAKEHAPRNARRLATLLDAAA